MSNTALKTLLLTTLLASNSYAGDFVKAAKDAGLKEFKLKVGTGFKNLEGVDQLTKLSSSIKLQTKLILTGEIEFNFQGGLVYETGSAKSAFNDRRYAPSSRASFDYAYMNYAPFSFVELQAGSIDNSSNEYTNSFVNSYSTSLGMRQIIKVENDLIELKASATQAIPSNDELSNRIGSIDEKRAGFYQEMIYAKVKTNYVELQGHVGHYAYEQLSSDVADADRYFGNTVNGTDENAAYTYTFKGWMSALSAKINFGKNSSITPEYSAVKNDQVQNTNKNTGSMQSLTFATSIGDNKLSFRVGNFENQSDTAPAYYNDSFFKNDYKGQFIGFEIQNPEDLTTTFKFINRTPLLNEQDVLGNEKVISIGLRKTYDIF